jgi:4,5-DOPA dioxygenase extradiol
MKMPVLFIGHGSPENILLDNDFTASLVKLGKELPRPRVILVISAHWLTNGTYVTATAQPRQIYDFYGFPEALYQVNYHSPGSPADAELIARSIKQTRVGLDDNWGLDHAAWAVLTHMYPTADIPVIEMSLDYSPHNGWRHPTLQSFYDLGRQLSFLRDKGVLIMGSGNIVHNLRVVDIQNMHATPYPWAVEFDARAKKALQDRDHQVLLDCQNMSRSTALSIPTLDHYLPMVGVLGLQEPDEPLDFVYEGFQNRSVSMLSFKIG